MEAKHTAGPWELDGVAIAGNDHRMGDICLMGEPAQYAGDTARMCDNWEANARLISAAPDLLQALKEVRRVIAASDHWWMSAPDRGGFDAEAIDAAIAKATGHA